MFCLVTRFCSSHLSWLFVTRHQKKSPDEYYDLIRPCLCRLQIPLPNGALCLPNKTEALKDTNRSTYSDHPKDLTHSGAHASCGEAFIEHGLRARRCTRCFHTSHVIPTFEKPDNVNLLSRFKRSNGVRVTAKSATELGREPTSARAVGGTVFWGFQEAP